MMMLFLKKATDTIAKQLADGWFTWTNTQQPLPSSTLPKTLGKNVVT